MDCLDKKTEYQNILLQIADTQNKLLRLSLDLENRFAIMIQPKKVGLFGRKKKTECLEKERLLYELDSLKTRARIILDISEDSNTFFWWNVPWDYVEEYLVYGLLETEENENWRHQYKWLSLFQESSLV